MVLTKQRGEGGPGCSLRTTLGCSHPLAKENNSHSTQLSLTAQLSSEKTSPPHVTAAEGIFGIPKYFFAVISFYHRSSPVTPGWIRLVSGLESDSLSRSKMFLKVPFLILLLGSLPFVALAQEGKGKVWLQLFPVISCNLAVSVLSHGLHTYSVCKTFFVILKQQQGTYCSCDLDRSSKSFLWAEFDSIRKEFSVCEQRRERGRGGRGGIPCTWK